MQIRKAIDSDVPFILNLLYELDRPEPIDDEEIKIFKDKIQEYFTDPQKSIIVAEENSNIVGLVSVIYLQRLNRAKQEMYIPEFIVTEIKRSSGIGKKLMEFCVNLAKKNECYRIRLESGNSRIKSHSFYLNLGFEQSSLSFCKNVF
ncbi:MAG: GNAT family N-acetyltransferase [Nitrosarchaeum sp.]|nr:GNAT family N-acetyltransferase [Nitrosarchaeum sp.]MCA9819515.1 GNAT family N-acetyltransferase [Nitrosarchaeum sp.]